MSLSNNIEPDPEFDVTLDIQLRRNIYKEQVLTYIREGVFSARRIVRKLYDPDDPVFTKAVILDIIKEVQQEAIAAWDRQSVLNDVLAFLEQNEELIEKSNSLIDRCDKPRDAISAINATAGLWKDRIGFLKDLGAKFADALDTNREKEGTPKLNSNNKKYDEMLNEADEIEAEFVEIEESA